MEDNTQDVGAQSTDHCYQAALIMAWINPGIAVTLLVMSLIVGGIAIYYLSADLRSSLATIIRPAMTRITNEAISTAARQTSPQYADADEDDDFSDTETSTGSKRTAGEEQTSTLLQVSYKPAHPPKPPPTISAMTTEQIRELSHLFLKMSAFTFIIVPFGFFICCLLSNNGLFCTYGTNPRWPHDLLYMLWIIVPGYLCWNYLVIFVWGEALAVVLGQEQETWEGSNLPKVQGMLAFIVQPALSVLCIAGEKLYLIWIERLVRYSVRHTEGGMFGRQGHSNRLESYNVTQSRTA
jgi:hypothetical protein